MAIDWDKKVLAPLMSPRVFGENADERPIYTPPQGAAFPIDGVFDRAYLGLVLQADGEPEIATREPVLGVRLSQCPIEPVKGGKVYIPSIGKTYRVANVEPDGKGHALLRLNLAKQATP